MNEVTRLAVTSWPSRQRICRSRLPQYYFKYYFWLFFNQLIFKNLFQVRQRPNRSPEEPPDIAGVRFFYRSDALSVTEPIVSNQISEEGNECNKQLTIIIFSCVYSRFCCSKNSTDHLVSCFSSLEPRHRSPCGKVDSRSYCDQQQPSPEHTTKWLT